MTISDRAVLELTELSREAERLAGGNASDRKKADVLLARCGNIRLTGISSDEARAKYVSGLNASLAPRKVEEEARYKVLFDNYIGQGREDELRGFLAGAQSITYTQGPGGGFTVPTAYSTVMHEAMSQVDNVLDETVTSFSMSPNETFQPTQISGFDNSTISGNLVGESVQQNPQVIPTVLGGVLRSNIIFKATFAASYEAETDIAAFSSKITRVASIALARIIGQRVLAGRGGTTDITGVVQALGSPTITNQTQGKLSLVDFDNIYFSVNRWYRSQTRCAWFMDDAVYKYVRASTDNSGRPLLRVEDDREVLYGKPIHICPSLATVYTSLGIQGVLLFGDGASIVTKMSTPTIKRSIEQTQVDITTGQAAWIARARCDAQYFDPSAGANPPLVLAAIS